MAASAPSFSSCDVVPQQCYRKERTTRPLGRRPRPPGTLAPPSGTPPRHIYTILSPFTFYSYNDASHFGRPFLNNVALLVCYDSMDDFQ